MSISFSLKGPPPDKLYDALGGLFIQMDYSFLKYWRIVSGARFEYNTSYKYVLIPRASLIFNKERFNTKLIYARAFRAPKPWDFTDGVGNPELKPEYFNSVELSNVWFATDYIKTDFSFYYNNLYNGIIKVNLDENNFYWNNTGNNLTVGCESACTYTFQKLVTTLNYTYNYGVNDLKEPIEEIAPHTGMLGIDYNFFKHFNAGLRMFYFGKRRNPKLIKSTNSYFIDEALVTNLYLSLLNYKNSDFQIIIKNLTNKEYYHTSNLIPDRFRQPQLSFFFKLTYKINKL